MKYDCGLTDAEHCEQQAWINLYDLLTALHGAVSDITVFVNEYSHAYADKYESPIADLGFEIHRLLDPVLKTLKEANTELRSRYDFVEKYKKSSDTQACPSE